MHFAFSRSFFTVSYDGRSGVSVLWAFAGPLKSGVLQNDVQRFRKIRGFFHTPWLGCCSSREIMKSELITQTRARMSITATDITQRSAGVGEVNMAKYKEQNLAAGFGSKSANILFCSSHG